MNRPCLNSACKSHGQEHPNCRCYGYSQGGEAGHYCDRERPHDSLCAYYAGGGEAGTPNWGDLSPEQPAQAAATPDWESLSPSAPAESSTPNWDDLQTKEDRYGSTGQQAIAGLEGAAQGVVPFGAAPYFENHLLGVPYEDIAGRAAANPITHGIGETAGLVGSMATGVGEGALMSNIAEHLAPEAAGVIGGKVIQGFITNGLIQGGDEISKGILGTGDPQAPVSSALAHMGAAGLFGGAIGGASGVVSKGLSALAESKLGAKASDLLLDVATSPDLANKLSGVTTHGSQAVGGIAGPLIAEKLGLNETAGFYMGQWIGKRLGVALEGPTNKYILPTVVKVLSSGKADGLLQALDYAGDVGRGAQKLNRGIASLFQAGGQQIIDEASDRDQDGIKKYISEGTLNREIQNQGAVDAAPQAYAKGGEVMAPAPPVLQGTDAISKHFPTQNILLQAAKGRVNNYLNGLRPQESPAKLPFDKPMKNAEAERKYDKAVAIAAQPLSILNHVAKGTLTPEALGHFTAMYPEIHDHISKEMTKKVTELQTKEGTIPYRLRQSMSLFLGSPLDTTLTPMAMQAAQSVYAPQGNQTPSPPVTKNKKGTSSLTKAAENDYTAEQSAQKRQASLRP